MDRLQISTDTIFCVLLLFSVAHADQDKINKYLNRCIDSKFHKKLPGPEFKGVSCGPWSNHSCCTTNTGAQIQTDGTLSLYSMVIDQCPKVKKVSAKCRQHFHRDTCFYECSPNFAPWIVSDPVSKKQRRERVNNIPLCATDCDRWFHDCIDDYTCNDNWGKNWDWSKKGSPAMCTKPCKTFKEYFKDPVTFCEKIFNYSFKYTDEEDGCMTMWPDTKAKMRSNRVVAEKQAKKALDTGNAGARRFPSFIVVSLALCVVALFAS